MRNVHSSILLLTVLLFAAYFNTAAQTSQKPDLSGSQNIINQTPAYFIENKGQWDDAIKFRTNLNGTTAFICKNNVVFDFYRLYKEPADVKNEDNRRIEGHVVNLDYSATARQDFKGLKKLDYFHNYFIGNDSTKWARHVALYQEVIVENFSEGIDARFYFENNMLRYDFIVKPGADLHDLSLKFDMGKGYENSLLVNECGELVMKTSLGDIINGNLAAYQLAGVVKRPVDCAFNVETNNQAGFVLGEFDKGEELVIDPLVYSTFIASYGEQGVNCIKYDISNTGSSGEVFVGGYTDGTYFPTISGAYDQSFNGNIDCFLTKISEDGDNLVYSTFLGGGGRDWINDFCIYQSVSGAWGIYITGCTSSYGATYGFPIPFTPIKQSSNGGGYDAFIAVLSPDLGTLVRATYLGGSGFDEGTGIKVYLGKDYNYLTEQYSDVDVIVVVGNTRSTNFPENCSTSLIGNQNGFISYINTDLNTEYSGRYFNGLSMTSQNITFNGLDIDPNIYSTGNYFDGSIYVIRGEFYIVGSTNYNEPLMLENTSYNRIGKVFSGLDCIIVKAKRQVPGAYVNDSIALSGTYRIGGTNNEEGKSIKFSHIPGSSLSYFFITGYTTSTDFAGNDSINVLNTSFAGSKDAFVARLQSDYPLTIPLIGLYGKTNCSTTGSSIVVGSINGSTDAANWRVNIAGTLHRTGSNSNDLLPIIHEIDGSLKYNSNGYSNGFIARYSYDFGFASSTPIYYHAYFGGSTNYDSALSVDMNATSEIYFAGKAFSSDIPVTYNSYNPINNSTSNCFVSKISGLDDLNSSCQPSLVSPDDNSCVNPNQDIDFHVAFDWNSCLSYSDGINSRIEIQISSNSSFTNPMRFDFKFNSDIDQNYYIGSYTVKHLIPLLSTNLLSDNTTYYWRALAYSNTLVSFPISSNTPPRSFNTNALSISLVSQPQWNMISSYRIPPQLSVETIMEPVVNDLVIMKNNGGYFYEPSFDIDQIGNWDITQGYQVYMNNADNLNIYGCPVVPESTAINLASGWNMISYLRDHNTIITYTLASINVHNNLVIVKDINGNEWVPSTGFNTIGQQLVGQGYQVYVTNATTLYYPANNLNPRIIGVVENDTTPLPRYLIPVTNKTGNSASIILHCSNIPDCTEIGIWSSNWDLIGSGKVLNGETAFTIWGNNEITETVDGALPYENLNIKAYNYQTGQIIDVNLTNLHEITRDTLPSNLYYYKNAIFEATAQVNLPNIQGYFNLTCLPNPFQGSTTISYNLPEVGYVTLIITDNLGNVVTTLVNNESQNSGSHNYTLTSTNIQTGVYYCILTSGEHTETIQLLIVQ